MNELVPLLEKLSVKLGTSSEFLWGVLVRQAPISATINFIIFTVSVVSAAVLLKTGLTRWNDWEKRDERGKQVIFIIFLMIISIIFLVSVCCLPDTIAGFINPEYWALNKILSSLKSK